MAQTSKDLPKTSGALGRRAGLILAVTCGAQLMVIIDETVVSVALPSIRRDLGFSTASLAWIVDAYMLLFGGLMLLGGRGADLFGRRRVFLAGLTVFSGASLLAGLAQSPGMLIGARAAQGLGGALLSPAALSILVATFTDPDERRRALGAWGGLAGVSGVTGMVLGGVITDTIDWRWVFFINVPIGILLGTLALSAVRGGGGRHDTEPTPLDGVGAALVTSGLLLLVYSVISTSHRSWGSPATIGGLLGAVALLILFTLRELRTPTPLIRLGILTYRPVLLANLIMVLAAAALYAIFFFVTLYMQIVHSWSPLRAGLSWLPFGAAMAMFSGMSAQLIPRLGCRNLLAFGLTVAAVGEALLLRTSAHGSYAGELLPVTLVCGAGFGLALVPLVVAAVSGIGAEESGAASGIINTAQQIGGAIGVAALATLGNAQFESHVRTAASPADAMVTAFHTSFVAAIVLTGVAALLALGLPALRTEVDFAAVQGL